MSKKKLNGKFTKDEIENIYYYLKDIYTQEDCFVKIFSKSNNKYYFYNVNSLRDIGQLKNILNSFGKNNLMISANPFKTMKRATEANLFSVGIISIDVDYKKIDSYKNLSPDKIIKLLEMDYFNKSIPYPTYIEHGNQIRLIYKLEEPVYIPRDNKNVLTLCNRVSEVFSNALKDEFGAEIQKSEKFIRIPHSINTKTNDEVNIIKYSEELYTLSELRELWLDELPLWYNKWNGNKDSVKRSFDLHLLNKQRLNDFKKIQKHLNNKNISDYRSRLCFLYHNYSILTYQNDTSFKGNIIKSSINDMLKFNENFRNPLNENKIIGDTKFLRNKQYKYSNDTLMNFLEIDSDTCESLNLESIYETKSKEIVNKQYYEHNKENIKINSKNYYEKNKESISTQKKSYYEKNKESIKEKYIEKLKSENKLTKKEEKEILKAKIKDLLAEGLLQKEIANVLNISTRTIRRYLS